MELMIFEGQLFSYRERQGNPNALRACEADGSSTIASDNQGEDSAEDSYLAGIVSSSSHAAEQLMSIIVMFLLFISTRENVTCMIQALS